MAAVHDCHCSHVLVALHKVFPDMQKRWARQAMVSFFLGFRADIHQYKETPDQIESCWNSAFSNRV